MMPRLAPALVLAASLTAILPWCADAQGARWYRGNTHAHTLNSDGDSSPETVARWYRDHGYHFTFITDHEHITPVAPLNEILAEPERFLVISGQEITQLVRDSTHVRNLRQVHVNALGTTQVNHPNWHWSIVLDDLLALPDSVLLEAGLDRLDLTRPGRAWIWVQADSLTAESILRALGRGEFYGSTGVTLADIHSDAAGVRIEIAQRSDLRYRTEFIGHGGQVLTTVTGTTPSYAITGTEGYVRARVTDSQGKKAWTQPVWVP